MSNNLSDQTASNNSINCDVESFMNFVVYNIDIHSLFDRTGFIGVGGSYGKVIRITIVDEIAHTNYLKSLALWMPFIRIR